MNHSILTPGQQYFCPDLKRIFTVLRVWSPLRDSFGATRTKTHERMEVEVQGETGTLTTDRSYREQLAGVKGKR